MAPRPQLNAIASRRVAHAIELRLRHDEDVPTQLQWLRELLVIVEAQIKELERTLPQPRRPVREPPQRSRPRPPPRL